MQVLSQHTNTLNEIIHRLCQTTTYIHSCNTYAHALKQTNLQKKYHKPTLTYIHTNSIETITTTTAATRPSHHTNTIRQTTGRHTYYRTLSAQGMWRSWEKQESVISIIFTDMIQDLYIHTYILTYIHTTIKWLISIHTYIHIYIYIPTYIAIEIQRYGIE
jgi:hypothetical protein